MYFDIVQIYKELFLKEQFYFNFVRARTFTRTFDRGLFGGRTMTWNIVDFCSFFVLNFCKQPEEKGNVYEFLKVWREGKI